MTDESAPQQSQWRKDYYEYLLTSAWRAKRDLVMARAGGQCEGCRQRPATQVHHKRYPKGAEPGSDGWIAREKLFDLVAVCDECHTDIHFGGDAGDAGYSSRTDVVRFGRYEGRTIEEMLRDRNYRRWFLAQPNLRVDQPSLFAIIANGGIAQIGPLGNSQLLTLPGRREMNCFVRSFGNVASLPCFFRGVTLLQASIVCLKKMRTKTVDLSVLLFCRAILRLTSSVHS